MPKRNMDVLANIMRISKTDMKGLIKTTVESELRNLRNGNWIETGLSATEKQIEKTINEALTVKYIKMPCGVLPDPFIRRSRGQPGS